MNFNDEDRIPDKDDKHKTATTMTHEIDSTNVINRKIWIDTPEVDDTGSQRNPLYSEEEKAPRNDINYVNIGKITFFLNSLICCS